MISTAGPVAQAGKLEVAGDFGAAGNPILSLRLILQSVQSE
jgi:hypothetical protein